MTTSSSKRNKRHRANYVDVVRVDTVDNPYMPGNGGSYIIHLACGHWNKIRQYRGIPKRSHCIVCPIAKACHAVQD